MKLNKNALFISIQIFMIVAGILFIALPYELLIWQVFPVVRYYPVVNQWAVSLPAQAGPSMGWYSELATTMSVSLIAMVISYAVAYVPFAKGRRLSPKLEILLTIVSITLLIIGLTLIGLGEYEDWGLRIPIVP